MKATLSIIIPVYNGAQFLGTCLDSIVHQSSAETEVIIVNDGSTDGSAAIADSYAGRFHYVSVIHAPNQGVSLARNQGLRQAKGEYILFVDADDWLAEGSIAIIMDRLANGVELLQFSTSKVTGDQQVSLLSDVSQAGAPTLEVYHRSRFFRGEVWNYVFCKAIIDKCRLHFIPGVKYAEDRHFIVLYLAQISSVRFIAEPLYFYRDHQYSAMSRKKELASVRDHFTVIRELMRYYHGADPGNRNILAACIFDFIKITFSFTATSGIYGRYRREINKEYGDLYQAEIKRFLLENKQYAGFLRLSPITLTPYIVYYKWRV